MLLALATLAIIGAIAVVGVLDERYMSARTRDDITREQQGLAAVLAAEFRAGIVQVDAKGNDAGPARVDGAVWRFEREPVSVEPQQFVPGHIFLEDGESRILLWSTAAPELRTLQGQPVDVPSVAEAVAAGERRAWLTPEEAARLGLPEEVAVAGLAQVNTQRLGNWMVIMVSSALRQREREARRSIRTVIVVGLAGLVVLGFGLVLFRTQRQELALVQALERETTRAQQEAQLAREGRAATMLTFAAGIAHELSTPLGVIATRAEQLEAAAEDDRSQRGARAISEQVSRIREQAQRFLAMARGAAPLRERSPAAEVLRNATARVRHRFDRAGVTLKSRPCDGLGWIRGDARLLEHALTNLLLNACDASPAGGAVELEASTSDSELKIFVADRGIGIDPSVVSRIQPFFSTKGEGKGTGLGLAIASEVMRMHRGSLTLTARSEGGTLAVLRLPTDANGPDDVLAHQEQDPPTFGR